MIISGDTSLRGVILCSGLFEMYRFLAFEMRELYCGFSEFFFPWHQISENQNEGQRSISPTRITNNLRHILYSGDIFIVLFLLGSYTIFFHLQCTDIKQRYLVFGITTGSVQQHHRTSWYLVDYGVPFLFLFFDFFSKCIPCPYFCWPRNLSL